MWTHRTPELEPQLTRHSIQRAARIETYRALTSGDLIAMTGSGATMVYGYPKWSELPALFVRAFNTALKPEADAIPVLLELARRQHIRNMIEQYYVLAEADWDPETSELPMPNGKNASQIIELLESLLLEIDRLLDRRSARETGGTYFLKARRHFAEDMKRKRSERMFQSMQASFASKECGSQIAKEDPVQPGQLSSSATDEIKRIDLANASDLFDLTTKLAKMPVQVALELLTKGESVLEILADDNCDDPLLPEGHDVLGSLFDVLGIRRVVTLNYDVEVERALFRQSTLGTGSETSKFRALTGTEAGGAHSQPETALVDGTRRLAISTTLTEGNVASVTNFATHPEAYEGQVLHFHGSANDPDSMILSQSDYLNRYAKTEEQRRSFDEAREILFGGNDVIFIGIGMSEEEVLQPLRRFLARTRHTRSGYCFTALMPVQLRDATETEKSAQSAASAGDSADSQYHATVDEARMAAEALELRRTYGVNVIHYGTSNDLWKVLHELRTLADELENLEVNDRQARQETAESLRQCVDPWPLDALEKAYPPWVDFHADFVRLIEKLRCSSNEAEANLYAFLLRRAVDGALTRVQSFALVQEFRSLKRGAERWWEDWRQPPGERVAQYSPMRLEEKSKRAGPTQYAKDQLANIILNANPEIDHKDFFFWSRQAQDYFVLEGPVRWSAITTANKAFREDYKRHLTKRLNPYNSKKSSKVSALPVHRRIARVAIPRGGGKGAFVSRFMDPTQIRRLFGPVIEKKPPQTNGTETVGPPFGPMTIQQVLGRTEKKHFQRFVNYRAGFMVHYTFSIEFSSVITALSRFFAGSVADALVQIHRTAWHDDHDFVKEMFKRGHNGKNLVNISDIDQSDDTNFSYAKFVGEWTTYPRLVPDLAYFKDNSTDTFPCRIHAMDPQVERRHRLDILRQTMEVYAWLCRDANFANSRRLFLCLSNLDRLCTATGDGFNAMHRSFFRLLTGQNEGAIEPVPDTNGKTFVSGDVPMDLLLVSGNPDVPIRYLSEEFLEEPGKKAVSPPNAFGKTPLAGLPPKESELHATASLTGVPLRKWSRVGAWSWDERAYMMSFAERLNACDPSAHDDAVKLPVAKKFGAKETVEHWRLRFFLEEMNRTGVDRRPLDPTHNHRYRFLLRTLWDNLALSNWVLTYWCTQDTTQPGARDREETRREFLAALDRAASLDGVDGVIREILRRYEEIDRGREADAPEGAQGPGIRGRPIRFELLDQIMRHMTLFALPVELWVLAGCPKIRACLDRLIAYNMDARRCLYEKGSGEVDRNKEAVVRRYHRLLTLRRHIDLLVARGLIVPIRSVLGGDLDAIVKSSDEERALHQRFILHGQIRAHVAKSMKLSLPAQGDNRNQQVSIYCDHSNETTTPSDEHYYLISELLETSIRHCRESLWTAAQFGDSAEAPHNPGSDRLEAAAGAAVRRLLMPTRSGVNVSDPEFEVAGLAGSMGRIHAVPQRLRAMMSLLRGTFSLGVMARLEHVTTGRGEATPFENYSRWLRSLSSAAASLEVNHETIEKVFLPPEDKKSFFEEDPIDKRNIFKPAEDESDDPETKARRNLFAKAANKAAKDLDFVAVQKSSFNKLRRPYYRDEIAWLYNERGLTALIQGRANNALQLFESARFIMTHKMVPERDSKAYHAVERRVLLNIAVASIEVGEIRTARGYLDDLLMSDIHVEHSTPSRLELFGRGYRGLCDHLSGSLEEAEKTYDEVIKTCSGLRFHRALAIFYRHRADLLSRKNDYQAALQQARLAEQAASEAGQQDIRHLAQVSVAQAQIGLKNIEAATSAIGRALDYGERMGIYRIQADALLMRAKLYMVLGDSGLAGTACSQAISLCNKFGLHLRKLTALNVYSQTLAKSGKEDIARSILTEAIADATRFGYQTMASDASRYLSILYGTQGTAVER